ncbi:hypothetical protein HPB52_023695 [Rhipicephalus sanguineus]|uniref:THAP-type domain-containing protein n=1 Tax=Rhipicephalus sanguineus TaxID=34632 RepID=A0A9D4TC51_RHISA|nr:hypothetical protein HPB52_023695 [Rhipicephalus sanguineus]
MPRTCCVRWIRSGCKGNDEKVSVLWLPRDIERREMRKRAIPRRETGGFTFDSPHVRVCEKHFDESGIVRVHQWLVGGGVVTSQSDVPKLLSDAVQRIFDGLPAYLPIAPPDLRALKPEQERYNIRARARCLEVACF